MKSKIGMYASLGAGVIMLSASAIFVRLAESPSSVTAMYRMIFAVLALLPYALLAPACRRELFHSDMKIQILSALSGFFLASNYMMWFESLRFTSIASSTVLVTLQPLFSIVLGRIFLNENLGKKGRIGCAVAIAGSFIIGWGDFRIGGTAFIGDLLSVGAAAILAAYFFVGQIVRRTTGAIAYSVYSYTYSAVMLLIYVLMTEAPLTGYPAATWGNLVGLALISTIGGQVVFTVLLKWINATTVTMGILGEPVGTCILAWIILGETITLRQASGMVIILSGLGLYFYEKAQQME